MRSIAYLYACRIKGWFKNLIKNPGKLVVVLVMAAGLFMNLFYTFKTPTEDFDVFNEFNISSSRLTAFVIAGIYAIIILVLLFKVYAGVKRGATEYTLADVQFIMTAPFKEQNVLLYGLMNQFKTSLYATVFLFFWSYSLKDIGYSNIKILQTFLAFFFFIISMQIYQQAIYIFTSRHPKARPVIKTVVIVLAVLLVLGLLVYFVPMHGSIDALTETLNSGWFNFVPVISWSANLFVGIYIGDLSKILLAFALLLLLDIVALIYSYSVKIDFYEDAVNQAKDYDEMLARKNGKSESSHKKKSKKKIKVRNAGINKGWGESTFLALHWREFRREHPHMISFTTIIYIFLGALTYILSYYDVLGEYSSPELYFVIYLAMCAYLMYFLVIKSPVLDDFNSEFFYYAPGKQYKKVIYSSIFPLIKTSIDAVISLIFLVFALKINVLVFLLGIVSLLAINLFYVAAQVFTFAVIGKFNNSFISAFVYIFIILICLFPVAIALTVAAVLSATYGVITYAIAFLAITLYSLLIYALSVFLGAERLNKAMPETN